MLRLTFRHLSAPVAVLGIALTVPAYAQSLPEAGADTAEPSQGKVSGRERLEITPYIEAAQVLTTELSPGSETLTYTRLAAGVDASIQRRNTSGALSLRYEHEIGWGRASDSDTVSGLGRVSVAVIPQTLMVEAGGLATRQHVNGGRNRGRGSDSFYSAYAGPTLTTQVGDVAIDASYRFGYSRTDASDSYIVSSGNGNADDSMQHSAQLRAGVKPGDVLPVGVAVEGGWYREDMSNFDQRIDDGHIRGEVTVPVSRTVALVGGVGYEKVKVSQRDVVRDINGIPVVDGDGEYMIDKGSPRQISYDVDGLIWDVGVLWRPSPRTSLEVHVGRRYGSATYYGNFSWQPTRRSSLNVAVYDTMNGFGGQMNRALVALPTDFEVIRDPVTGELNGCVNSLKEGNCLTGALGDLRSTIFRARGVSASYTVEMGRITTGIGIGYERRKYVAARN